MLTTYFKLALRSLKKNKFFSAINIFGLATGLACCMLIAVYVYDELNYDKYPADSAHIYRVGVSVVGNGGVDIYPMVDGAVGQGMKTACPEIISSTRLLTQRETFVKYGEKQFKEQKLAYVDSNFLQLFSIPFLEGNAITALNDPGTIVITKSMAARYFGGSEAMGKSLVFGIESFKVTGVIDKIPDNTHFHFDGFLSMASRNLVHQTWSNIGFYTYLRVNKLTDPQQLEAKFPALVQQNVVPEVARDMGVSLSEAKKSVNTFKFFLQPLTGIHLHGTTKYELEPNGDIKYVYIFSALALFILLLACVNFTNLSTANAARRAREVGMRKVMGSEKSQLVFQFLAESVLLAYCAIVMAYLIVYLLLPSFTQLSGKSIEFSLFFNYKFVSIALLLGLVVGMVAGIYPAFFLSSFKTLKVLKASSSTSTSAKSPLRSGLVVFQFAVSTGLIIATIIVYLQLQFMQDKRLGYDKEQVLYLQDTYTLGANDVLNTFKQNLLKDSRIVSASIGTDVPGNTDMDGTQAYSKDKKGMENGAEIHINVFHVDYDYLSTLGIPIVAGRNFSKDFATDSFAAVINETAARELGWPVTDAINKTLVTSGQHAFKVIGVVADFHYASVKQKITPLMIKLGTNYRTGLIVKFKTRDLQPLLTDIKNQWQSLNPGAPFSYFFLDNKFASLYAAELKTGQIFTAFAVIAILIACLGLFGLSTYTMQQRTKEIGVRKIFGASVNDLIVLVSKDFLQLVLLSFLIAIPLAGWAMYKWLQDFAYRVTISWWIFALSGLMAIIIAIVTISFQAVKAALMNPVKALRSE